MRISDWSSDVCSSDLIDRRGEPELRLRRHALHAGYAAGAADSRAKRPGHADRAAHGERTGDAGATATRATGNGARLRSEGPRLGRECVSTCRSRWSPAPDRTKKENTKTQNKEK